MKKNLSNGQGFFYSIFQGNKLSKNDIQGIQKYVTAIDSGTNSIQAFEDNLTGCSVAAQKYIKDAEKAGQSTEEMIAGLNKVPKAGGKVKSILTNLGSTMANMATGMIVGAAIQFALNTIITALNDLVNAYKNSIDEMRNYQSKISSLKSETESLNKELKETKEKIYALENTNPDNLNLFDEDELKRLKEYNDELERKLRLDKAQLEVETKKADTTAKKSYKNSQLEWNPIDKYLSGEAQWYDWLFTAVNPFLYLPVSLTAENATNFVQGNTWDQQMDYLSRTEEAQERYKKSVEDFNNFVDNNDVSQLAGEQKEEYDKLLADKNTFENDFNNNYLANLSARYNDWQIELNSLNPDDLTNQKRIEELEKAIARYDAIVNKMSGNKTFAEVYNSAEFSDVTKELEELAKAGKLTEDTFNNVDGIEAFVNAVKEVCGEGTTAEKIIAAVVKYVESLGGSADGTSGSLKTLAERLSEVADSASGIVDNTKIIQDAISKMTSGETLSFDEVIKLLEIDPSLADDFIRTADGYKIATDALLEARNKYIEANKGEVESKLETAKSDIKNYKDEIKKLEEEKASYEDDLKVINDAKVIRNTLDYDNLSDEDKKIVYDKIQNDSNDTHFADLVANGELLEEEEKRINGLIGKTQTNIDLANGNLDDSVSLVSALELILDQIANPFKEQSESLSDIIDRLSNLSDLVNNTKTEVEENGSISLDTLKEISSTYPQLEKDVSNYLMGLIDEKNLLEKLNEVYEDSLYKERFAVAQKVELTDEELQSYLDVLNTKYAADADYYTNIGANAKNFVDYMADTYNVDLDNCENWLDAKKRMHEKTMAEIEAAGLGLNIEDYFDFDKAQWKPGAEGQLAIIQSNSPTQFSDVMARVYAILDSYTSGVQEFGKLFKSADVINGITGKTNSTKDVSSSFFDWVQVKLDRLKTITSNFIDSITDTISKKQSESYLNSAIKSVRNEKKANQKAIETYTAESNKIGLSAEWKRKIQNGDYSLDEVKDPDLAKKIQDYQELWDKIKGCKQNVKDLTKAEQEYITQREDLNIDDYEYKANRKNYAVSVAEGRIDTKNLQGKRVTAKDYDAINKALTAENTAISQRVGYARYLQTKYDPTSNRYKELQEIIESGTQAIKENTDTITENNNKKFEIKIADYERSANNYSNKVESQQNAIDLTQAQGKKVSASAYKNMIAYTNSQNAILNAEKKAIEQELKTVKYGSERYDDLIDKLRTVDDTINSNKINQAEWNAEIRNIPIKNIQDYLDIVDAAVAKTKSYVERLSYINGESTITADLVKSQKYSEQAMKSQKELYQKYLDEYYKAKSEGRTADAEEAQKSYLQEAQAYNEMLVTNEEIDRQARDILLYRNYEQDLQHIEDVKKALNSLEGMLNDNALYNEDGSFSNQGIAKIALTINQLEQARASVADYKSEIDALNKAHEDGSYNDDEYAEKLRELTEGYQGATSEVNQYIDAIKDLYKNQAQEELNVLNELIDTRQEALEKKKSYYDYDRTIRNKTKDITAMQMQIEALNGVSTAEAKAQKALLQEQIQGLEEDLADTQAEHIYQMQIDGLNEQKEILQDIYDTFIDSLNKCLDTEQEIISSASYLAVNSVQAVNDLLKEIANARGYDIGYIGDVIPHFADGGLVRSRGKDDGLAWLKAGEYVLNENAYKAFKYSIPAIDSAANKMTQILGHIDDDRFGKSFSIGDINLVVQGNVDKSVMSDLKKYQKQLTDSVISTITKDLIKTGYKR